MNRVPSPPRLPSPEMLAASWERSHAHGVRRDEPVDAAPLARGELRDRLVANARLLALSRPMIEGLYRQIGSPSSTVLLADQEGMILSALGDPAFLDRASAVALRPGIDWSEARMGTNAIGTALATGRVTAVEGEQHYLERNRILTCVATPILAPTGGTLGILDVSTDARDNLAHAGALLRTTAELIEYRLLETLDEGFLTLHFHARRDALADALHGLAVFDEDGRLVASNRRARALLELDGSAPHARYDACFATPWSATLQQAAQDRGAPFPLLGANARTYIARAGLRTRRGPDRGGFAGGGARAPSQLGAMVLGDARIARVVDTLRECAATRTPLLFEGEMGTGKAFLMRAFHADHGARAPLVGLDCSTLSDADAAEEAFGRAQAEAAGGVLFLVEIDALPAALQARLFAATGAHGARVVGAVRRPLAELERAGRLPLGRFRAAGGRIASLPPLRERDDFDALVRQFVREVAPDRTIDVAPDAMRLLRRHPWPGNIRELRNQLRLILALVGDEARELCPDDIPAELLEGNS